MLSKAPKLRDLASTGPRNTRLEPLLAKTRSLPQLRQVPRNLRVEWSPTPSSFQALTGEVDILAHMKSIPLMENRGMMIGQLQLLLDFIKSHSKYWRHDPILEGWHDSQTGDQLTYKTINLYNLNDSVIKPMTMHAKCSYVEAIAFSADGQMPSWFVSHWWGQPFLEAVTGIQQHAILRHPDSCGVTSAYWICAFAHNQHIQPTAYTDDHKTFPFYKALCVCQGVLMMTDSIGPGVVFERVWCNFEWSVATESLNHLLFDVAASDDLGMPHVLTEGLTAKEKVLDDRLSQISPWHESGRTSQVKREERFPVWAMTAAFNVKVVDSKASHETDRVQILKAITGKSASELLDLSNPVYDEIDRRLRARFAIIALRSALQQRMNISDDGSLPICKAIREDVSQKSLAVNLSSCWRMTDADVEVLATCFPRSGNLKRVTFKFCGCYQLTSASTFLEELSSLKGLTEICLDFEYCTSLCRGEEFLSFSKRLATIETLKKVDLNFIGCQELEYIDDLAEVLKAAPRITDLRVMSPDCIDLGEQSKSEPKIKAKMKPKPKKQVFKSITAQLWANESSGRAK